ncbi:MAG: hypothetical protein ACYTKC_08105, partial [Planctomycetota bacterium]
SSRHRSSNRLRSFDQPQSRADYTLRQQVVTNQEAASQDILDRALVLENLERLRWRGGRMVLV